MLYGTVNHQLHQKVVQQLTFSSLIPLLLLTTPACRLQSGRS